MVPLMENLLGTTVVVEDLDCGIQMAKRHDNRFRIVTLDGQVINAGGSMTGGSVSRNAGILSRSGELEQLEKKRKKIQSQLQDAALMAESANRELQKAQYELEVAKDQQRRANDRVLTLEGRKNHFDILLDSLKHQQESLRIQKENLQKRSTDDAGGWTPFAGPLRTLPPGGSHPGRDGDASKGAGGLPAEPQ